MNTNYYRPTQGESVGCWNVFSKDGSDERRDVPFEDLPADVQQMIRDRGSIY